MHTQSTDPSKHSTKNSRMKNVSSTGTFGARRIRTRGRAWAQRLTAVVMIAVLAMACSGTEDSVSAVATDAGPAATPTEAVAAEAAAASGPTDASATTMAVPTPAAVPEPTAEPTAEPEPLPAAEPTAEPALQPEPAEIDCTAVGEVAVGLQTGSFFSGEVEWEYQWTVPSSYDGTPIPVVLDFHGFGSSAGHQAKYVGWPAVAEAEGFLAVQPQGQGYEGSPAAWTLPQFDTGQRDDTVMVLDLLDHIAANVCIDPARIYSTGFSLGGSFTSVLICELGDVLAAAMSVGGVTHPESCNPTRPVPYLAFHGTKDRVVLFAGQDFPPDANPERKFLSQSMPGEFSEFADDFGCDDSVDSQVSESVTLTSYTGCDDDVEMGFYAIEGGGHTWPGAIAMDDDGPFGVRTMEIDANAIAWEFFQRHSLSDAVAAVAPG